MNLTMLLGLALICLPTLVGVVFGWMSRCVCARIAKVEEYKGKTKKAIGKLERQATQRGVAVAIGLSLLLVALLLFTNWCWRLSRAEPPRPPAPPPLASNALDLPRKVVRNPRDGQLYGCVPPGEFRMGCPAENSECRPEAQPVHVVAIPRELCVGMHEVSRAAFERYAFANSRPMPKPPGVIRSDDDPILGASFEEAVAFAHWAGCRMLTEAEYEYCARGGAPNPAGIHFSGLWEYTADFYDPEYYSYSPRSDPRGPKRGLEISLRQGWHRRGAHPLNRPERTAFRLVCDFLSNAAVRSQP